ncbi:hypothetical protein NPIL_278461 [Nephila pilipes]|uniref:Uncharacterized protein n=1 Tax=Nephila pilipes TaxID=299642 RepID=A0A8X6NVE3_NEPPI|nr:hypothetical protein NPIL_278461 [Nephila pilipes]
MDDFLKLENKRSTYRAQLTKLFVKIDTDLNDQDTDLETLKSELEPLLIKDSTVKELNSEIEKNLKPEEIEKEIDICTKYEEKVILYKIKLKKRMKQLQPDSDQNCSFNSSTLNSSEENSVRIPPEIKTVNYQNLRFRKIMVIPINI